MLADRLGAASVRALRAVDGAGSEVEVDVFELRDYAHDITDHLLTGFAPPALESMIDAVVSADALIAVTPIFSSSYSGLFKSFIDVLSRDALRGTPVLIGANAGTARHSLAIDYAIRPLFAAMNAEPVSTGVFAASADWAGSGDSVSPLGERIERAATQFAEAIVRRGFASSVDDAYGPPAASRPSPQERGESSFEDLLSRFAGR